MVYDRSTKSSVIIVRGVSKGFRVRQKNLRGPKSVVVVPIPSLHYSECVTFDMNFIREIREFLYEEKLFRNSTFFSL